MSLLEFSTAGCTRDADLHLENEIVGRSPAHAAMLAQLRCIAQTEAPALIEGETGCGKELAARAIHYGGPRHAGPFVPINCGALPDNLIESELFGHARGAFTDARQARAGLVAEAHAGTLFLDEVDALSAKAQIALLRFLQDQLYRPVGATRELRSDVRLIAASNRPLGALVAQGGFRADLLYRLQILHLRLPPLRERGDDVRLLAEHFARRFETKYGLAARGFDACSLQWLRTHDWPGNVRELENWVHRYLLMGAGADAAALAESRLPGSDGPRVIPPPERAVLDGFQAAKAEAIRLFEFDYLRRALRQSEGNVTRAAQLAGKERRAFGKLLKKHGIAHRGLHDGSDPRPS